MVLQDKVGRRLFLFGSLFLPGIVFGCTSSETRSLVSYSDIPPNKYRKVAVFVEQGDRSDRAKIELAVVAAINGAGLGAKGESELFPQTNLSQVAKGQILQRDFDVVLYVRVLLSGMTEQLVSGARHDGRYITIYGETKEIDLYVTNAFVLKPDGSVYQEVPTLHTKSELQDTKTAKIVWIAETIATGGTLVLTKRAADQIVEKLRADNII